MSQHELLLYGVYFFAFLSLCLGIVHWFLYSSVKNKIKTIEKEIEKKEHIFDSLRKKLESSPEEIENRPRVYDSETDSIPALSSKEYNKTNETAPEQAGIEIVRNVRAAFNSGPGQDRLESNKIDLRHQESSRHTTEHESESSR